MMRWIVELLCRHEWGWPKYDDKKLAYVQCLNCGKESGGIVR